MATTVMARQSAVMVQQRVVWLRHGLDSNRIGTEKSCYVVALHGAVVAEICRVLRGRGKDMQWHSPATAWQGDGTHGAGIAYLATHWSRKPSTSIGKELSSDGIA